jgi:hypothetical protein
MTRINRNTCNHLSCQTKYIQQLATSVWPDNKDYHSVYVVGSVAGVCMGEERSENNMFLGMVGTMNYPLGNLGRCARKV